MGASTGLARSAGEIAATFASPTDAVLRGVVLVGAGTLARPAVVEASTGAFDALSESLAGAFGSTLCVVVLAASRVLIGPVTVANFAALDWLPAADVFIATALVGDLGVASA